MCALGQSAAYLAKHGCTVTAFDYTAEMIHEAQKRFSCVPGLNFVEADIVDFSFPKRDYDFCFISSTDINLLPSIDMIMSALKCIGKHLRCHGGLGIELRYPAEKSFKSSMQTFHPRVHRKDNVIIWKESESVFDVKSGIQKIHQIVHVEDNGTSRTFDHQVELHTYSKDIIFRLLEQCGYMAAGEYCDHNFNTSRNELENNFLELMKIG